MHILVIPSERLVPSHNKLEGIFPYHQAVALAEAGYKVGALSIDLSFSVPMIVKGAFYKLIGKKAGNATDDMQLSALLKLGIEKIFSPQKFLEKETLNGVVVYRINGLYRRKPVANKNHLSWIKAGLVCFDEYVKENGRPDVVHAHEAIYAGMLAEEIFCKRGVPYIITEHSTFYATGSPDERLLKRVKTAQEGAAGLFAVSESFAQFLNQRFTTKRFRYLPNVLDPQLETAACTNSKKPNGAFTFLNLALFKPVKDQETLLKAFAIVAKKNRAVQLRIGGKGDLEKKLKDLAKGLSLENNVKFLGELDREEVIDELNRCDCFVLSSKYETFGVVLIEALLFGKPVVSTAVGVAGDIINKENGYVVDVADEKALANAMLSVTEKQTEYKSDCIRRFAVSNFGKQAFVNRMNKIYSEVA